MKCINIRDHSPVIEPLLCITLTEERGKFLVCGMKKGHLFIYNRSKGGKKFIANVVKKESDIVGIADLVLLKSKFFAIQDSRYYIRLYSADQLFYDLDEDERPKPFLEIS